VAFLTQLWFFATPVVYPISKVPEPWRPWYGLNPMAGVVEGFRWALLGAQPPDWRMLAASVAATVALLAGGLFYFRRMEKQFADLV
jgi:lipopolysaccharide transport system permease protein